MLLRSLFLASALVLAAGCAASTGDASSSAEVTSAATAHFGASAWEPTVSGTPKAGGSLAIDYDFARLPRCRNQGRVVSWIVAVSYRFDGGPTTTVALPGSPGAAETLPASGIAIPAGATSLELWFENKAVGNYDHCDSYDSRYGANYTLAISE